MINFEALEAAKGVAPTAKNISRLARLFGDATASWAFTQWDLRAKAKTKFGEASSEMLFTPTGLEQASHHEVAKYHASLFPPVDKVADLTCGIGGDLRALAARGAAIGFEVDETTARYAAHNAPAAKVDVRDCLTAGWDFRFAFADPSRRSGSRRTLDPTQFSPSPLQLAKRMRELDFGLMKLSPMLSDDFLQSISGEVEFISYDGECREALAIFHRGSTKGYRAVHIEADQSLMSSGYAERKDEPLAFVSEADPAAIRAHCLPALCEVTASYLLGDSNGYLTSSEAVKSPWLKSYSVLEYGQFDIKRVRTLLKKRGGGPVEVKSRARVNVADLRPRLSTHGETSQILMLFPVSKSIRFAIVEPQ